MLSYLASALPPCAGAEARMLAVQCALRADAVGMVRLPVGLLRGMRMAREPALWQELEDTRWLCRAPERTAVLPSPGIEAQLLDVAILAQAPGRPGRRQAADWAVRVASRPPVRTLPAAARLTILALIAHLDPENHQGVVEADRLHRSCGLSLHALFATLDQLVTVGAVAAWAFNPATEDLHWALAQGLSRPGSSAAAAGRSCRAAPAARCE